ncbi:MAG: cytochrome c [Pirellulaceae bacterium]
MAAVWLTIALSSAICAFAEEARGAEASPPPDVVRAEVRAIVARLKAAAENDEAELSKATVGADAAVLGALAVLSDRSPYRDLPWHGRGTALAHQAKETGAMVAGDGADHRRRLNQAVGRIVQIIAPTKNAPHGEAIKLADAAPRPGLMWRMDRTLKLVREQVTSGEQLNRQAAQVAHETALLQSMAEFIGDAGYEFTDDEEFQQLRRALARHADAMATAAKTGDVERLQMHRTAARESCKACHRVFRN